MRMITDATGYPKTTEHHLCEGLEMRMEVMTGCISVTSDSLV